MCIKIDFHLCRNDLVSKQAYTSQIRPRLHCTYDAMQFENNTTWQTDDTEERYTCSFIYNCSAIKEITLLLENKNREELLANKF